MSFYDIHLRADSADGIHTKVTVFMNGINCGQLTFNEEAAIQFHEIFTRTNWKLPEDKIISSGKWTKEV
jgi:hypothetical protein